MLKFPELQYAAVSKYQASYQTLGEYEAKIQIKFFTKDTHRESTASNEIQALTKKYKYGHQGICCSKLIIYKRFLYSIKLLKKSSWW